MVCSRCRRENDAAARFCDACGARLDEPLGGGETRRVVTVVFTDVAGSTALGERLDPEALRRVMPDTSTRCRQRWNVAGGTVEKFIGDAIVAVFTCPPSTRTMPSEPYGRPSRWANALERVNEDLVREYGVRIVTRTASTRAR